MDSALLKRGQKSPQYYLPEFLRDKYPNVQNLEDVISVLQNEIDIYDDLHKHGIRRMDTTGKPLEPLSRADIFKVHGRLKRLKGLWP
jgi:hypothetical protein